MAIQKWSESVILVNMNSESRIDEELQGVTKLASKNVDCDIVVQFPFVNTISSSSITELLRLHKSLTLSGRRLILSSVSSKTKKVLRLIGLDRYFEITTDYHTALSKLQETN
jgi:anti-anti-sigma factor